MFDIFNKTDDEEVLDETADLDLEADDPGGTDTLDELDLAGKDAGANPDAASDPEPDGGSRDGPNVTELEARVDDLEDQLDSAESSLRAVRDSQSEISDDIEEMNDTVRRLVGMYDRFAAEDNPFVDGPDDGPGTGSGDDDPARSREASKTTDADGNGSRPDEDEDEDDPFVSLEQLRGDVEVGDPGGSDGSAADPDHRTRGGDSRGEPDRASDSTGETVLADDRHGDELPTLTSIPDGYAGDVLVMEWLSVLMSGSGPSGALRAIEHYEDAGWISPALRDRLVDIIGGPSLDTSVDPTQFPRGPTAESHATSHDYLRVLVHLQDL